MPAPAGQKVTMECRVCQFRHAPTVLGVGHDPTTSGFSSRRCYHLSYPSDFLFYFGDS